MKVKMRTFSIVAEQPPEYQASNPAELVRFAREHVFNTLDAFQEHFIIIGMDTKNKIIGFKVCHSGGIDFSAVDFRVIFRAVILLGAVSFCCVHNHPSGDVGPSDIDRKLTDEIKHAAKMLGLSMLDHIILGYEKYYSFSDLLERQG